jgi:hypothetical protein
MGASKRPSWLEGGRPLAPGLLKMYEFDRRHAPQLRAADAKTRVDPRQERDGEVARRPIRRVEGVRVDAQVVDRDPRLQGERAERQAHFGRLIIGLRERQRWRSYNREEQPQEEWSETIQLGNQ